MIGTRLAHYEITAHLGSGGFGDVYQATDSKLGRSVALKLLPEAFASDTDRLSRFRREAQVLASLSHPNIAAIHGFEDSGGRLFLVMELVDGETLQTRLKRGAIPVDEALTIAKQIAEALETAHDKGVVHRDLKPGNVMLTRDGKVKVLDFGLAKANDSNSSNPTMSNSPTMASIAATNAGIILGTAAYMSPEQARGKTVDKRADIWAFGVVLFEMLTGQRAFPGEDLTDTLASVVKLDPKWDSIGEDVPSRVRQILRVCLQKDPKQRAHDIADIRLALEGAFETAAPQSAILPEAQRARLPWVAAALLGAGLVATLLAWAPWRSTPPPEPRRLLAGVGADAFIVTNDVLQGSAVAVSPDGRTLVFMGARKLPGSRSQLFVRKLDQLQATPLDGTEGAFAPFFSPDSEWIAFFEGGVDGVLKKIPVAGGATSKICAAYLGRGGWWAEDDTIVFSQIAAVPRTTLMRVPAAGGTPVAFGAFGEGATSQRWPQVLPGGKFVLYTEHSSVNRFDYANLAVAPLVGGAPKIIVKGGSYGRYVASGPNGYLTYVRQQTLMAVPFDLSRLEATGPAAPVVENVSLAGVGGSASVAISPDGTLVYLPDTSDQPASAIQWLSRDGKTSVLRAAETRWFGLRVSPDGRQLALVEADKQRRIFMQDLNRDIPTQVTAEGGASDPVWTPDGKRLAYASDSGTGVSNLWLTNADGSGNPTRLTTSPNDQQPYSWDPAGKFLAYTEIRANTARDVMILPVEGDASRGWKAGTPIVFKATAANEREPAFSPDGRWIAYTSSEGGADDVFVSPFPGPGATVAVSIGGGINPRWSGASHELLFWTRGKIMSASYTAADTFAPAKPQLWAPQDGVALADFDLHPDGKRVAIGLVDAEAARTARYTQDKIVFWSGFFDYLRKNVVPKK